MEELKFKTPLRFLYTWFLFCIIPKTMSLLLIGKSIAIFQILSISQTFQCVSFSFFMGLGRGLACMAINCLYSVDGGQLILMKGQLLFLIQITIIMLFYSSGPSSTSLYFFTHVIGALGSYLLSILKVKFPTSIYGLLFNFEIHCGFLYFRPEYPN